MNKNAIKTELVAIEARRVFLKHAFLEIEGHDLWLAEIDANGAVTSVWPVEYSPNDGSSGRAYIKDYEGICVGKVAHLHESTDSCVCGGCQRWGSFDERHLPFKTSSGAHALNLGEMWTRKELMAREELLIKEHNLLGEAARLADYRREYAGWEEQDELLIKELALLQEAASLEHRRRGYAPIE